MTPSVLLAALLCAALTLPATSFVANRPGAVLPRTAATLLSAKGGGGKKKKSQRSAQTTKGFGVPPPKLDDVLAGFKTRAPDDADSQPCPCGSEKVYSECCGPFHGGEKMCATMTDVLRSRYTAFSWRNIEYVMATTHETCRDYREDRVAWAKDLDKSGMVSCSVHCKTNELKGRHSSLTARPPSTLFLARALFRHFFSTS